MNISLVRMPPDGLVFKHHYKAGELDTREYDFVLKEPPLVEGRAMRAGNDLRLRGSIKATVSAPCDRCLNEVIYSGRNTFRSVLRARRSGRGSYRRT